MYSRKSVGPRIEPCGTPVSTGYSCEDSHSEPVKTITEKRGNKANYLN